MSIDLLQSNELEIIRKLISEYSGITFSCGRAKTLDSALNAHCRKENLKLHELRSQLQRDKDVLHRLTEEILIHETYFLREQGTLEQLISRLAGSKTRGANDKLKIWSAGCSTGEEPYSVSILLSHSIFKNRYEIVATDISESALNTARAAIYSQWSLRDVSEQHKSDHFLQKGKQFSIKDERVKDAVTFLQANLLRRQLPQRWCPLDAIVCRNVLIYFDRPTVEQVAELFFDSLLPGGYLVSGASDPLLTEFAEFHVEYTSTGVIYQRPATTNAPSKGLSTSRKCAERTKSSNLRSTHELRLQIENFTRQTDVLKREPAENVMYPIEQSEYRARRWENVVAHLMPNPNRSPVLLIRSLLNLARTREAADIAESICKKNGSDPESFILWALALLDMKRYQDSVEQLRKAIFLDDSNGFAHYLFGISHFCMGNADQAVKAFSNATIRLKALPEDAEIPLTAEDERRDDLLANINSYLRMIECKR